MNSLYQHQIMVGIVYIEVIHLFLISMRFVHFADCHIDGFKDPRLAKLGNDNFKYVVNFSLEKKVDFVLLAGDFNTWNTKRSNYFCAIARTFALEEVVLTRKTRLNHFFRHLDHIYCRGLKVVEAQVHTHIHSSDHFPISLTVSTTVD